MSFASSDPHVSSLDEKPLTGYRGISVAAVLTLVLGSASALALVHPLLWVLPPLTVAVAVVALRAIDAEGSMLTGRGLALAGMSLALVFGLWAPARVLSRQWQLYRQARVFADEWFELVRTGKLPEAHQLSLPHADRQLPGTLLSSVYEKSLDAGAKLKSFYEEKPAKTIAALGDRATYRFRAGAGIAPREFITEHIALDYVVTYEEDGREKTLPVRIVLDRDEGDNGRFRWRVRAINDPNRITD